MDIAEILRHILIVLIAAKAAAELAERIGIPAVVGEIVAGILVGPSVLNAVGLDDQVLRTLGEIGVILLLLDVGIEMDLGELAKVGRASMLVATVGVVTPLVLGTGAMVVIGNDFKTALFVGAALTATSVGITARVFGDLRALATTEARIVLGAAVADDVMGLVVLTVVVRLVTEGSVSALSVAGIVAVAVAFLVLGGLIGVRAAPPLFAIVERVSRSTGTLVALALAFTLGFAEVADAAQLAPIVGAFVAGIALSKTAQSGRIRRELAPVGHLFIPVFFLQIGIDADVGSFFKTGVLRDAAILLVVAVVGKVVSPLGAIGTPGDKALIGLGMLPRGEVGLIFATLGLQNHVLDNDLYAALLLVVLVTTLATPQLLKIRFAQLRSGREPEATPANTPAPAGGWLRVTNEEVGLTAQPPDELALPLALDAAIAAARRRPAGELLDWLARNPDDPLVWSSALLDKLLDVTERGNARSWRFLQTTGVLARALPELDAALQQRADDDYALDPLQSRRFRAMERLRQLDADDPLALAVRKLDHIDHLLLAVLFAETLEDEPDPVQTARTAMLRLPIPDDARQAIAALIADRDLLWAAAHQPGGLTEQPVLQLADHLGSAERARALYLLSALRAVGRERWELERIRTLHDLIQSELARPDLSSTDARNRAELHKRDALAMLNGNTAARARVSAAPRDYVLRVSPEALAGHALLLGQLNRAQRIKVAAEPSSSAGWLISVAAHDQRGLLAAITRALADAGLSVDEAVLASWDDGSVIDTFHIPLGAQPGLQALEAAIRAALDAAIESQPVDDARIDFDQAASPWHTICEVRAPDQPGLLHSLAAAFAAATVDVRSAKVTQEGGLAIDRFEITDSKGGKLSAEDQERFQMFVRRGVLAKRRRFSKRLVARPAT
ncbi:MAG: cation:proton antiporter [Acidimicrobiales bacterium]